MIFSFGPSGLPNHQSIHQSAWESVGQQGYRPSQGSCPFKIVPCVLGALFLFAVASSAAEVNIPDGSPLAGTGIKRIVIDAGHGGKDPGGPKLFGLKEKELNLLAANSLYALLKKEGASGFAVGSRVG
ncbi:MAG: N-acetylmuramoyl-L-alanine amidase [Elusimicrobia bacterium]|nr:N-acetylmuramoyl-L-alanine amidase [Elusimicrobiota bacterium]